jgi:hypothetical protein
LMISFGDLYLGVSSLICCVLSSISHLSLSLCLISCPSSTVFASWIENTFSHGCISVTLVFQQFGCLVNSKSVPDRWVATFISEVPPNPSQYIV